MQISISSGNVAGAGASFGSKGRPDLENEKMDITEKSFLIRQGSSGANLNTVQGWETFKKQYFVKENAVRKQMEILRKILADFAKNTSK